MSMMQDNNNNIIIIMMHNNNKNIANAEEALIYEFQYWEISESYKQWHS